MRRTLGGIVAALGLVVGMTGTAGAAPPPWETSLTIPGNIASVEAIEGTPGGGPLWAVGGRSRPGTYDEPTAWRYDAGAWKATTIPVDLTSGWGYLTGVAPVSADDVWAVGLAVTSANGRGRPLAAHWDGRGWRVVNQSWIAADRTGSFGAVVARSANDVWLFGNDDSTSTSAMAWHFNGSVWSRQTLTLRNTLCGSTSRRNIADAVATADAIYLATNCQESGFQFVGTISRFASGRWRTVFTGEARTRVNGLGASPDGTVWAAGGASDGISVRAQAWRGGADGFLPVGPAGPPASSLTDAASNGRTVAFSGETAGGPNGPLPLVLTGTPRRLDFTPVPYDRYLSSVFVQGDGRLWVGGPTFGGWLGGDPPHAAVLTRAPIPTPTT